MFICSANILDYVYFVMYYCKGAVILNLEIPTKLQLFVTLITCFTPTKLQC